MPVPPSLLAVRVCVYAWRVNIDTHTLRNWSGTRGCAHAIVRVHVCPYRGVCADVRDVLFVGERRDGLSASTSLVA